ncbi:hypothetical protein EFD55_01040 [Rhizobium pisi]|uniref:Uncharacterized protein n=1 Tax=Rhizobium pisi TaxID=574561 RepID=A0A427N9A5_9HYPH|nr:hypothetical protein EFD55_01040 [Rhizobium pisi]
MIKNKDAIASHDFSEILAWSTSVVPGDSAGLECGQERLRTSYEVSTEKRYLDARGDEDLPVTDFAGFALTDV